MPGPCLDATKEMEGNGSVLNALEVHSVSCRGDANVESDAVMSITENTWFEDVAGLSEMSSLPGFDFEVFDLENMQRSIPHKLKSVPMKSFRQNAH